MQKLRAFVVEDSPIILQSLTEALEEESDVRVVGTASGEFEALTWLAARVNSCDVIIIDIFLKSGSGLGVLEGLRAADATPERVVLTNYATPDMRARCMSLGAEIVFDKSNEIEEMLAWFASRGRAH